MITHPCFIAHKHSTIKRIRQIMFLEIVKYCISFKNFSSFFDISAYPTEGGILALPL